MKGGFDLMGMLPLVLIFVVMYFLIIRPQNKKAKQHRELLNSLGKGSRVLMNGGLIGLIKEVRDQELSIEIAPGVEVSVARSMVAGLADSAPAKALEKKAVSNQKAQPTKKKSPSK